MKRRPLETEADWERLLSAAAHLQQLVPDAILVGGSAAAIHAGHRYSADDDHVVAQLRDRFAAVLNDLEAVAGWKTARVRAPVLILGKLDGIETGIRNQIRTAPLETMQIEGPWGRITLPTLPEMLRIKAWLVVRRNATRDYLDAAALADKLGMDGAASALQTVDDLYPQSNGESVLRQIARQFAEPRPYDLGIEGLDEYRLTNSKWTSWERDVVARLRSLAVDILSHF